MVEEVEVEEEEEYDIDLDVEYFIVDNDEKDFLEDLVFFWVVIM